MKNYQYILTHSSGNLTLEYNPVNWATFNVVFSRSQIYHSVLRNQVIDIELPFDGKAYVDTIYAAYGIGTDIGCEIKYLDKSTRTYTTLYTGIIDLSEWSSLRDTTTVKVIDNSVMAKFEARHDIAVPISRITDLDEDSIAGVTLLSTMNVEGVDIEQKAEYDDPANEITITTLENSGIFAHYYGISDSDYDMNDIGTDADLPDVTLGGATGPLYTNNSGGSIDVRYRIVTSVDGGIGITGSGSWNYSIRAYGKLNGATLLFDHTHTGSAPDTDTVSESYDSGVLTQTMAAGETIELYHQWNGDTSTATITPTFAFAPVFIVIYEITAATPATDIEMPLLFEVGAKLLQIMTGVADPLDSTLLGRTDSTPRSYVGDGDYSLNGLATGNMLRGFLFSLFPIVTSFKDYFKSIDALFNFGLWYNGTEFEIKAKADYYKVSKIITLGEVQDLEVSIAGDHYFNKVVAGYRDTLDYEDVNGREVFGVRAEFTTAIKRNENTLDIASVYHGDDYGIELARKNRIDLPTAEDSKYDDLTYFITGQRDGGDYITLQGYDDFTVIDGVYSPDTRLNLNISTKRNMNRHENVLSVPMFITNNDVLYLSKQFELALSTQKSGDPVVYEKNNIVYSEEALYYPEVYNFTAPLSNADVLQLISDPHGYVEFDYLGVTYSGYILEVSTEPFNRKGNWTLIRRNPNR